jgi:hypothetical protein
MKIARLLMLVVATTAAVATDAHAQAGEELIIVGAGNSGSWHTEFEFANPLDIPVHAGVGILETSDSVCVLGSCPVKGFDMPASGVIRENSGGPPAVWDGVRTFFVASDTQVPTVRAWLVNLNRPLQTVELPVVRQASVARLQPTVLAFPSALRTSSAHSNLVVAEVGHSGDLLVAIEAFSPNGQLLGSREFFVATRRTLFLVDVLAYLGVPELPGGQIRVRKLTGNGLMWGVLATLHDDGRITVSQGAHP